RVELKEVRAGPDIGAVERGEDGRIADNADAEFRGACADLRPLTEEKVLDELVGLRPRGDLLAQRGFFGSRERADVGRPFPPRAAGETVLNRGEQRVAGEPGGVVGAKFFEITVGQ